MGQFLTSDISFIHILLSMISIIHDPLLSENDNKEF